MTEHVHVEAARIPTGTGCSPSSGRRARRAAVDEIEIEVARGRPERLTTRSSHLAERMIMRIGAPFVPIKHEGVIYIRPPAVS